MEHDLKELRVDVWWEAGRYASRDFPFSKEDVEEWLNDLPAEDIRGVRITISDASVMGQGGLKTAGQYIKSAFRKNPIFGLCRLYTMRVRHLKKGPVYTSIWGKDWHSWESAEMEELEEEWKLILAHEIGHFTVHKEMGRTRQFNHFYGELLADKYASDPHGWKGVRHHVLEDSAKESVFGTAYHLSR